MSEQRTARRDDRTRLAALLVAALLAPVVFRGLLVAELTNGPVVADLRGLISDLGVALLVASAALLAARAARWLGVCLIVAWTLLQDANYEIVRELGSLASYMDAAYLGNRTFVLGSASYVSHPLLLAVTLASAGGLAWAGLRAAPARAVLVAGVALPVLAANVFLPWTDEVAFWRQTHFAQENVRYALLPTARAGRAPRRFADPPTAMLDLMPELRADLDGEWMLRAPGRPANVLIVVIESLSGAFLRSMAEEQQREPVYDLARLDALARANVSYPSFLSLQRRTNRGLYAILCGELPNLLPGTPKMTEHAGPGGWRRCLPEVLREAGFQTVYLQAAPLSFMLKGPFMERAGFDRVYGRERFGEAHARALWGVDDRTFYDEALRTIRGLERDAAPWFLTLLTVGTHHPTVVPEDFMRGEPDVHARALQYADMALAEFVGKLAASGSLDDTLVLITSDESRGSGGRMGESWLMPLMTQNWGVLVALVPGGEQLQVHESFSQMDLAISVLDYLGLAERGAHFFGRSVFRRYGTSRYLFFANTNHMVVGALDPAGHLLLCQLALDRCHKYALNDRKPFARVRRVVEWDPDADAIVMEMARRSVQPPGADPSRRDYDLVEGPAIVVPAGSEEMVVGGQYLDLRPDQWAELELEIEARGAPGTLTLHHKLHPTRLWSLQRASGFAPLVDEYIDLSSGEILRLRYAVAAGQLVQGLQCRINARNDGAGDIELWVHRAHISVRWAGDRPSERIERRQFERVPAG